MVAATFVANHARDAIGQACQQTSAGGWRGVYRRDGGLVEVHNAVPDTTTRYNLIALVVDGVVTFDTGGI